VVVGSPDQDLCIRDYSGPNGSRKGVPETIIGLRAEGACVNETLLRKSENQTSMCASRIAESLYTDCSCAEVLFYCYNATAERSAVYRAPQNFPSCSAFRSTLLSCIPFQSIHSDHRNVGSDSLG